MKLFVAVLLCALALSGAQAQEACDAASAGASLIDLTELIGTLACKLPPSVNLGTVMGQLTGTLKALNADQLKMLPGLIDLLAGVQPSALTPFLSLSADELERLVPVLGDVPVDTLKVVLPLLAQQEVATLRRMLRFLSKLPRARLQQLAPALGRVTQGQINVMVHALNVLPEHAWDKLIAIVQATGPATDIAVAIKKHVGLIGGGGSNGGSVGNTSAPATAAAPSHGFSISIGPKTTVASTHNLHFGLGKGRKMLQACDAAARGLEVGVTLLGPFGDVVCKFGPETLKPVLTGTINALLKQSPETLARLPALTSLLGSLDARVIAVFFKIPPATLQALVPLFAGLDASKLGAQLKLLASVDAASISTMTTFLKAVPGKSLKMLIDLFAKLTDKQADIVAKLMTALSPGQAALGLHLLENFGFAVDAIGQHVPQYSG